MNDLFTNKPAKFRKQPLIVATVPTVKKTTSSLLKVGAYLLGLLLAVAALTASIKLTLRPSTEVDIYSKTEKDKVLKSLYNVLPPGYSNWNISSYDEQRGSLSFSIAYHETSFYVSYMNRSYVNVNAMRHGKQLVSMIFVNGTKTDSRIYVSMSSFEQAQLEEIGARLAAAALKSF